MCLNPKWPLNADERQNFQLIRPTQLFAINMQLNFASVESRWQWPTPRTDVTPAIGFVTARRE